MFVEFLRRLRTNLTRSHILAINGDALMGIIRHRELMMNSLIT